MIDLLTAYLDIEDALQVVERYGFHIRDVGLLASALARPATTVLSAEACPQLPMKAAALLDSVARFYPLIDGNKRTAWTLMVLCSGSTATGMTSPLMRHLILWWGWPPAMSHLKSAPG